MVDLPRPQLAARTTNARSRADRDYPEPLKAIVSRVHCQAALQEITTWPGYQATPLVSLRGLAAALGISRINYKDESCRFEVGSFKALGGAYAVLRLLQERIEVVTGATQVHAHDLTARRYREITESVTVASATDGNHGRSVAWGAQAFGCRCVIYIHATVSESRKAAIERYGAEVIRVNGNYDEAVRRADADARNNGWMVVSDTSYEGYTDIPRDVMRGYTVMAEEIVRQLESLPPPTHLFIQGGVGALAAAICAHFWETWGARRPATIVVEPASADCILRSIELGRPVAVGGDLETMMAGLACGEVSTLAWDVLREGADAVVAVSDAPVAGCMRALAQGIDGDPPIVAGESAVAGLAGLLAALCDPEAKRDLGLDAESRILLIGSEGATDPVLYEEIVGRSAESVRAVA
jgi:diaminopropionate ammonia-lyase